MKTIQQQHPVENWLIDSKMFHFIFTHFDLHCSGIAIRKISLKKCKWQTKIGMFINTLLSSIYNNKPIDGWWFSKFVIFSTKFELDLEPHYLKNRTFYFTSWFIMLKTKTLLPPLTLTDSLEVKQKKKFFTHRTMFRRMVRVFFLFCFFIWIHSDSDNYIRIYYEWFWFWTIFHLSIMRPSNWSDIRFGW